MPLGQYSDADLTVSTACWDASDRALQLADHGSKPMPTKQFEVRPLLGPPELADFLRVPEHTLAQWRYQGLGPAWHRVGRHVRYTWADIEAWLSQQQRGNA